MSSYKKLFNNVIIFSLGNLGSKVIAIVLVPIYTYYLTQGEYGTADLVMTTVSMLMPIVSLSMYESLIRYIIKKEYNKEVIVVNAICISLVGYSIFLMMYPILGLFNIFEGSLLFLYILLFFQMINQIISNYARAIGETKIFAINGILTTFLNGLLNIILIVVLNKGLIGYYLAFILGYLLSTIYLVISINPFAGFSLKLLDKKVINNFFKYSLPLIPNNLMWWLINGSSRYFINGYVGIAANGLFAVSSRIPAIINILSQVFSQAWQLSAFEEYEKEDKSSFYSNVFDVYISLLLISTSIILIVLKPIFELLFSEVYFLAWQPVPFLILGTVFSAVSAFMGVAYTASQKTEGIFKTSIYGGVISLILNFVFIPKWGIVGAGISSMLSFFLLFIIRYYDTKNILIMNIKWGKLYTSLFLISMQIINIFVTENTQIEMIVNIFTTLILLVINRYIINYAKRILKNFKRK